MMMIFGICLILGAFVDIFMASFSISHLFLLALGAALIAIHIVGGKIKFLSGIGKSLVSLFVIVLVVLVMMRMSNDTDTMDKETADVLKEADDLFEDKGFEATIQLLEDKNIDLGWHKEFDLKMAELYMEEDMYAESANTYSNILRNLPQDQEIRLIYAEALFLNGDYNGAHREGSYISKIDPECAEAYVLIGDVYQVWNDHFREKYYYKIAVGLDEASVEYRVRLAEAYGRTHSYEEAITEYEIAKKAAKTFDEEILVYESYIRFADADSQDN